VSIQGYNEVKRIADSFNHLLTRLQTLEKSRQEFVSNVSHELKTPITSMKVLSDSLLMQDEVPAELYREFMLDIAEEIEREDKIINDLLSLVKLDKTAGEMNISQININDLLEQILKRLRPIAAKRNIELVYESFRPVMADVDEVKLSLAISNLIENAIKYNFDDGWVRVSLNADHKFFYITVADSGVGIPEELQDQVFERFYRVDKARSRETGGTGLGLSITKSAVLMHRGAIKVYSKEKEGTTFTVRIPLNYIA
ncbi:MAG: ATP-binding protein, partial [Acetivibrio sp.]